MEVDGLGNIFELKGLSKMKNEHTIPLRPLLITKGLYEFGKKESFQITNWANIQDLFNNRFFIGGIRLCPLFW